MNVLLSNWRVCLLVFVHFLLALYTPVQLVAVMPHEQVCQPPKNYKKKKKSRNNTFKMSSLNDRSVWDEVEVCFMIFEGFCIISETS